MSTSRHPGPSELNGHLLTRSELTAMLEHFFYRMKDGRGELAERMPDAYQRLTGASEETMGILLADRIGVLRQAALTAAESPSYDPPNTHIRDSIRRKVGG